MSLTIDEYLQSIGRFVDEPFGRQLRSRFADKHGSSELAVLQSPGRDEYEQFVRLVSIMTPQEKADAGRLTDQQVQKLAADAKIDSALAAIFLNGYALRQKEKP